MMTISLAPPLFSFPLSLSLHLHLQFCFTVSSPVVLSPCPCDAIPLFASYLQSPFRAILSLPPPHPSLLVLFFLCYFVPLSLSVPGLTLISGIELRGTSPLGRAEKLQW